MTTNQEVGSGRDAAVPAYGSDPRPRPKVWFAVLLVLLYWGVVGVTTFLEVPTFTRFVTETFVFFGILLVFLGWWLFNGRVRWADRLAVLGCAVVAPVAGFLLADETLGPIAVMGALPVMLTVWAAWLLVARKAPRPVWLGGLIALLFASTLAFDLFRMEGLKGEGQADLHWRWSARPEETYLAARQRSAAAASPAAASPAAASPVSSQPTPRAEPSAPLAVRPGDWPGFRGPDRDSVVRGVSTADDWTNSPPKELWRRPAGPAWSSVAVVDGRLFTQEQRGDSEAVVCLDAATGSELWAHEEPGRFSEALSSIGPRATPQFAGGRVYAQGAAGRLVCLDAATGQRLWSRDTLADAGAKLPDWGVTSSPLVAAGKVVVFAGGQSKKGLVAYDANTGDVAWTADAGLSSYSSPHLANLGGRGQVLFIGSDGLVAVDPASGSPLWKYSATGQPPRSLQPTVVAENQLLVPMGMEVATDLLDLSPGHGGAVTPSKRWSSRNLKPSFNDFVVHDGHAYGFDQSIFTCVELKTGNRKWKQGRYGTGQVLLLADSGLLVVVSDQGRVVLLAAKPDQFEERGEFQAVAGKTWNHPAVAQGRLYVRNARELACYELPPPGR